MLKGRDIISINELTVDEIKEIFKTADKMLEVLKEGGSDVLKGFVMATAFFEPSTRTRLSFQTAMVRLGGNYIDLAEISRSSLAKGENFADTIRMLDSYADVIIVRHKIEGAARFAAEIAESPVINAGDGMRHHPTQALIDLYTIRRSFGSIDDLTIGVLGDLKYGRAATSFIYGVTKFNPRKLHLISPESLRIRLEVREHLASRGIEFVEESDLEKVLPKLDVLYVTRIQKERFPDPAEYEKVKGSYKITRRVLEKAKENLIILHPLPRVEEISLDVDGTPYAKYFEQAKYGVPVRMALLKLILKG
ncbi:MAG: aspartate carbamoyltransferase [Thermoproteales archaeon]|nr:aspartate carbamoyltransferase [Thermoproteales archaeon]RLE64527.1 MAG: aspartate carbamoyltransferase [Thermoprotei archaeon]